METDLEDDVPGLILEASDSKTDSKDGEGLGRGVASCSIGQCQEAQYGRIEERSLLQPSWAGFMWLDLVKVWCGGLDIGPGPCGP